MKTWRLLFSVPMARAFVEGRKTVTRRLDRRLLGAEPGDLLLGRETWRTTVGLDSLSPSAISEKCVDAGYSVPWAPIEYVADGHRENWLPGFDHGSEETKPGKTRVSIHMPDWASRIRARIVSVREERLDDITEDDAKAEGLKCLSKDGGVTWKYGIPDRDGKPGTDDIGWEWQDWSTSARHAFARLWARSTARRCAETRAWCASSSSGRCGREPLSLLQGVRRADRVAPDGDRLVHADQPESKPGGRVRVQRSDAARACRGRKPAADVRLPLGMFARRARSLRPRRRVTATGVSGRTGTRTASAAGRPRPGGRMRRWRV